MIQFHIFVHFSTTVLLADAVVLSVHNMRLWTVCRLQIGNIEYSLSFLWLQNEHYGAQNKINLKWSNWSDNTPPPSPPHGGFPYASSKLCDLIISIYLFIFFLKGEENQIFPIIMLQLPHCPAASLFVFLLCKILLMHKCLFLKYCKKLNYFMRKHI